MLGKTFACLIILLYSISIECLLEAIAPRSAPLRLLG
jgi:hypothetical protein